MRCGQKVQITNKHYAQIPETEFFINAWLMANGVRVCKFIHDLTSSRLLWINTT